VPAPPEYLYGYTPRAGKVLVSHRTNLGILLRHVHLGGPTSRVELAERMGVNRSTILALTAELTAAGLVREELPTGSGKAGRPSLVIRPASDRVYVLAFDVAVDRLVAARVALGGAVLDHREAVRARAGVDLDNVVGVLARFGRELAGAAPPGSVCAGVGASYCGMIRPDDGVVRFGPDLGWVDQAFGAELGRRLGLGLPVRVGNEAHLGAQAEHERGAGTGFQNLIYLHGDVGVGGGIIVAGRLLDGDGGYACELGHMLVNPYDGVPAENAVRAGHAACWYSCNTPPRRSRRWMVRWAIWYGSVIGSGSSASGRALPMPWCGRCSL
jgi:hypothetical protein